MDQQTQPRISGSYTANLLGNIKSHLAGLQGYDVMALELIQNADDAKADSVVFDITDRGLLVVNSGKFTYCGDLHTRPCSSIARSNYSCDYHRIADVGSGGKLSRGENIGRFGIGFVSTYQVTDHPEIRSSGVKLTLHPEEGQWFIEPFEQPEGTTFFLPWADDPNTKARLALGVSHVSAAHIDQLVDDFQKVLRKSLLFLRHVRTAEVRRNGELLLACDLDRSDGSDLIVSFRPSGEVEQWHILRADVAEAAARLYASHPRLESLGRGTKISIGLRIDPQPLAEGVLYAFLPTEQSTGLPMHINADFFPESDRKSIMFAKHENVQAFTHEHAWNAMLIDAAAAELARDPEGLRKMLGDVRFWQLVARAYDLKTTSSHPTCFMRFWERLSATVSHTRVVRAQDGSLQYPRDVFAPSKESNPAQVSALLEIGGRVASDTLSHFRVVIQTLGAHILTFERLVTLLEQPTARKILAEMQVKSERLESFYRPLWEMVNQLLPDTGSSKHVVTVVPSRLTFIPFLLTENLSAVTIGQAVLAPVSMAPERFASLLPRLTIATHFIHDYPKIARLIQRLDLGVVTRHLSKSSASGTVEGVISVERTGLRDLYALLADLDLQSSVETSVYQTMRSLPIWLSSRGLIKATQALLPGNFTDPTGQTDLLDASVLTDAAREFVSNKLGVRTLTIEAFVQNVLPSFFNEDGPLDEQKFNRLVSELASHPALVNDESLRRLLGSLPIVPTQDGRWSRPTNTYRRTDALVKVLGDATHLWLDASRVPTALSVHTFLDNLGIRRSAMAQHLVERMVFISENYLPTDDTKRASSEAFYALCDHYDDWKEKSFFKEILAALRRSACFPAEGDTGKWHLASSLYTPYRAEAFRSQANILDFRNTVRLKPELLEVLGMPSNPETKLVIDHLLHCVKTGVQPHNTTYRVLTERAERSDPLIATLSGSRCIYIESLKIFVRPNQIFWSPQHLGRYAFTIPGNLETFKPLFTAIGVKNAPEGRDYIDCLLDIVGEYFEQSKPITGADRSVYDACLTGISSSDEREELNDADIRVLQKAPTILNLLGQPTHPDEVLLQDSEWHAGFFNGELDQALCKPAPELWPLMEKAGVKRLSERAKVTLEFVDGAKSEEQRLADGLIERIDILARLLHDKPTTVRQVVRQALSQLTAVSHELVRIQASVFIGDDLVSAPPSAANAFYDIDKHQLILARPVGERSWPHVLNAIFHQLIPEESGSEISKLTLMLRPLMSVPVEVAHSQLTDAGIPLLEGESASRDGHDLTSASLDNMGAMEESSGEPAGEPGSTPIATAMNGERVPSRLGESPWTGEPRTQPQDASQTDPVQSSRPFIGTGERGEANSDPSAGSGLGSNSSTGYERPKAPRAKHKEQWDRRLLSYVRKQQQESPKSGEQEGPSEHNLAVEVVARAAVCAYEKTRGRIAEQMAQTHPGYDIISRNPLTGEDRFIEVKGVNGEWNHTGVGLSRLQFSNAQNYGDRYWLYVVEFVSDPGHTRVHAIRSPATQVTSFMFDGNWRDAVAEERVNPLLAYIEGTRVRHKIFGVGVVTEVMKASDSMRVVRIQYGTGAPRPTTLNLMDLPAIESDDDNDHS